MWVFRSGVDLRMMSLACKRQRAPNGNEKVKVAKTPAGKAWLAVHNKAACRNGDSVRVIYYVTTIVN